MLRLKPFTLESTQLPQTGYLVFPPRQDPPLGDPALLLQLPLQEKLLAVNKAAPW